MPDPTPNENPTEGDIQKAAEANSPNPGEEKGSPDAPPKTYPIKVNGEDREVTEKELLVLAQKGAAADAKFQEAAALKKESERASAILEGIQSLRSKWDPGTFRQVAEATGMSQKEIEETIQQMDEAQRTPEGGKPEAPQGNPANPPSRTGPIRFSDLDDETKDLLISQEKARQDAELAVALEKDEVIGYNIKKQPDIRDKIIRHAKKVLRRRVAESGGIRGDRTQFFEGVASEVRTDIKELGTLFGSTPTTGLGPAPGSADPELYPTKEPERKSATDAEFEDFIVDKMGYLAAAGVQSTP